MRAGSELDALVAEKVMGWKHDPTAAPWVAGRPTLTGTVWYEEFPHYSTDIAAAWEVVTRLEKDEYRFDLTTSEYLGPDMGGADAKFSCKARVRGRFSGSADTAPRAICLAALKAVGVEV